MVKIRKDLGVVLKFENGYLQRDEKIGNFQSEFMPCIKAIQEVVSQSGLDVLSIYVTGAIAKGTACRNISDLDLSFIFMDDNFDEVIYNQVVDEIREITLSYEFTSLDYNWESLEEVIVTDFYKFCYKYRGACIYGKDIVKNMKPFHISSCYFLSDKWEEKLDYFKKNKNIEMSDEDLKITCLSGMKTILRLGFELVMDKEQVYTNCLYPCYSYTSKHYPETEPELKQILLLAINPTTDRDMIMEKLLWAEEFFADKLIAA